MFNIHVARFKIQVQVEIILWSYSSSSSIHFIFIYMSPYHGFANYSGDVGGEALVFVWAGVRDVADVEMGLL